MIQPRNATRSVALAMAIAKTSSLLLYPAFQIMRIDPRVLPEFLGPLDLVLLVGLILSSDHRLVPAVAFAVWLGAQQVLKVSFMRYALPFEPAYPMYMVSEAAWMGVIAAVAVSSTRRPAPTLALLLASFVLLVVHVGLGWAGFDLPEVREVLGVLQLGLLIAALLGIVRWAVPPERSQVGWPLTLLALIAVVRVWFMFDVWTLAAFMPIHAGLSSLLSTETALIALSLVAFHAIRRPGVSTLAVTRVLGLSGILAASTLGLEHVNGQGYLWRVSFLEWVGISTSIAIGVAGFLQWMTLRELSLLVGDDRLVSRGHFFAGLVAATVALGVLAVGGSVLLRASTLVEVALVGLAAVGFLLAALAAVAMWVFWCVGLANALNRGGHEAEV